MPYYVFQLTVFSLLNQLSRSALLSDIYTLVLTLPLVMTVIQVMLNPFSKGFNVTPKGTRNDNFYFNWRLAWPLILLFISTAISLWWNLGMSVMRGAMMPTMAPEIAEQLRGINLGWIWSIYNLLLIGVSLLILLDVPKPDLHEWFDLRRSVRLDVAGQTLWGVTTKISEVGAEVALTQLGLPILPKGETLQVTVEILEEKMLLQGQITQTGVSDRFPSVQIVFEQVTPSQHRVLVEMLFCRPGQWKRQNTPGELQSLWLLLKILFKPRVLFDRQQKISVVSVSQV